MTEPASSDAGKPVSKTRRKKEMHALQALGEALVALSPAQLSGLDLPERLADALAEARRVPSFEGRRRQMQYIGRLMREVDPEPIERHLALLRNEHRRDATRHQEVEQWRDRLLADDAALGELKASRPGIETEQLHQLVRNARREAARGEPPRAQRLLFRALRDALQARSEAREGGAGDDDAASFAQKARRDPG